MLEFCDRDRFAHFCVINLCSNLRTEYSIFSPCGRPDWRGAVVFAYILGLPRGDKTVALGTASSHDSRSGRNIVRVVAVVLVVGGSKK